MSGVGFDKLTRDGGACGLGTRPAVSPNASGLIRRAHHQRFMENRSDFLR